jgi:hypothetical protein
VALLNRSVNRCCNQNHESNGGFPLHPSHNSPIGVNKKGYGNVRLAKYARLSRGLARRREFSEAQFVDFQPGLVIFAGLS